MIVHVLQIAFIVAMVFVLIVTRGEERRRDSQAD